MDQKWRTHRANTDYWWIHGKANRSSRFLLLGARLGAGPGVIKNMALRTEGELKLSLTKGANA